MDAKLSSRRIMSAACLDTSEPDIPMATPGNTLLVLLIQNILSKNTLSDTNGSNKYYQY